MNAGSIRRLLEASGGPQQPTYQTVTMTAETSLVFGPAGTGEAEITHHIIYVDNSSGGTLDLNLPPEPSDAGVVINLQLISIGTSDVTVKDDSSSTTVATLYAGEPMEVFGYTDGWKAVGDSTLPDNITVTGTATLGTVATDTITEATSAAGVTADGVLLKDGGVTTTGNSIFGNASTDTNTFTGRMIVRTVTDAGPMTATGGTVGEIVYNDSNSTFYGCTVTHATAATWAALN